MLKQALRFTRLHKPCSPQFILIICVGKLAIAILNTKSEGIFDILSLFVKTGLLNIYFMGVMLYPSPLQS